MGKTKIEWTNQVWNPVWGCLNNGECRKYCYARKIAKRFQYTIYKKECKYRVYHDLGSVYFRYEGKDKLIKFEPIFLESNFQKKFPQKPCRIFIGSMSEIYFWKEEWMEKVLAKIKQYPQHIFQFLTKFPEVYEKYDFPDNCWLGLTIINQNIFNKTVNYYKNMKVTRNTENIKYLSLEPMHSKIVLGFLMGIDWIIVGAETGIRKGKIIPKKEWIDKILNYCKEFNIPIFLKDN